ncbi:MAG: nucleotidyltransferase family protein [Nitrososphaerales archaeon]|nr:nucleotidyltransferase family protein [Nitrososphaerales archaeon]
MESVIMLPANGLEAAQQVIDFGETRGVRLRLLGGLAFKLLCPSSREARYYRENKDIDLMGRREDCREVMKIMETLGYKSREVFNKLSMGRRLIYYDMVNRRRVDIFLDEFEMCHKFNFKDSLAPDSYTLPLTELMMTKLQVVEKTEKEYLDLVAAFHDYDVTNGSGEIEGNKIAEACSKDWGVYATFTKSLAALLGWAQTLGSDDRSVVVPRIERLTGMIESKPKGLSWKMRARIGEKARWYEIPDSDGDTMLD